VTETGKGVGEVTGDLTFHGVTKPVTLAVKFQCRRRQSAGQEIHRRVRGHRQDQAQAISA